MPEINQAMTTSVDSGSTGSVKKFYRSAERRFVYIFEINFLAGATENLVNLQVCLRCNIQNRCTLTEKIFD